MRKHNIFRAFTGANCPRMNQAEVVHAAWANRNEAGLSLQQAAEFDTKDSLILEVELKNYEHSANSNGCGPSLVKLGKRKQH